MSEEWVYDPDEIITVHVNEGEPDEHKYEMRRGDYCTSRNGHSWGPDDSHVGLGLGMVCYRCGCPATMWIQK